MRLREGLVRHRLGLDWLHMQLQSFSPWELRPPWARFPVFVINKAQFSSSKLVRTELRCCCYCIVYYFGIKNLWRQDLWCNAFHVWMVIVKCLWGIICIIDLFFLLVNCWPWRRELPLVGVRDYSSLIYAFTVGLFQISWSCMYFKFNCMLSNCLFPATPMF